MTKQRFPWREASPLKWIGDGVRGRYTAEQIGRDRWLLTGVHHDGLSFLQLPVEGALFPTLPDAMRAADRIDVSIEGEASGC